MTGKSSPQRRGRGQDLAPVTANLGRGKYVVICGEIGAGHVEDFWWCPDGDVERIRKVSRVYEYIVDALLVFSGLETIEF